MESTSRRVVITGGARDLGRALAIRFAESGAEVLLSSRDGEGARRVCTELRSRGLDRVHAFSCDLGKPESIRAFAAEVSVRGHIDVLINNGAAWLEGSDIGSCSDEDIVETISSATIGSVLMVKHFLPLLRASSRPDIVNIVSSAALPNTHDCAGHVAFYAAKAGQGRLAETLSLRLRSEGIRVISLYPPKFDNFDPLSGAPAGQRTSVERLSAESVIECVLFAVNQPRDCFIRKFEFESVQGAAE
jgi:NAD(P)-dependent dehydrogenase (short-subunit alcohol dehydrogenase family)